MSDDNNLLKKAQEAREAWSKAETEATKAKDAYYAKLSESHELLQQFTQLTERLALMLISQQSIAKSDAQQSAAQAAPASAKRDDNVTDLS